MIQTEKTYKENCFMFYKNARIFTKDFSFQEGVFEVTDGNSGADFSDGDYEGLKTMAKFFAQCGATSFAPAPMTVPYDEL